MNWLIPLVLLAAAYYFFEAGLGFLAVLTIAALVVVIALSGKEREAAHGAGAPGGGAGPTIIESAGEEIPERMNIKIKPDWTDQWSGEYVMQRVGYGLDNLGRGLVFLLTGRGGKKAD
jgi:hypothetical protein